MIRCAYFVGSKRLKVIKTHFLLFYGICGLKLSKILNFLVTLNKSIYKFAEAQRLIPDTDTLILITRAVD